MLTWLIAILMLVTVVCLALTFIMVPLAILIRIMRWLFPTAPRPSDRDTL